MQKNSFLYIKYPMSSQDETEHALFQIWDQNVQISSNFQSKPAQKPETF